MAFNNISLQTEDVLLTDFIPDAFTKVNSNFTEIVGNFEDLVNTLQIDYVNAIIGVDTPIQAINTQNIALKGGALVYTNSAGTQVGSLTLDSNNLSVLTVNSVVTGSGLTSTDVTSSGTATLNNVNASGNVAFTGAVSSAASIAQSPGYTTVNLAYDTSTNLSKATITLTNKTSKNLMLTLSADSGTYSGSFNAAIQGVQITLALDPVNPPTDGMEFCIALVAFVSGSINIAPQWGTLSKQITIVPDVNVAIQDNAPGALLVPIVFDNTMFKSNITFLKVTAGAQARLLIVSEKNMID